MTVPSFGEFMDQEAPASEGEVRNQKAAEFETHLSQAVGMNVNVRPSGKGILNVSQIHTDDPEKFKTILASLHRFASMNGYAGIRVKDAQPGSVAALKGHGFEDDRQYFSPNGVALLKTFDK